MFSSLKARFTSKKEDDSKKNPSSPPQAAVTAAPTSNAKPSASATTPPPPASTSSPSGSRKVSTLSAGGGSSGQKKKSNKVHRKRNSNGSSAGSSRNNSSGDDSSNSDDDAAKNWKKQQQGSKQCKTTNPSLPGPQYPLLARDVERYYFGASYKEVNYTAAFLQDRGITQYPSSVFALAAHYPAIAHSLLAIHDTNKKNGAATLAAASSAEGASSTTSPPSGDASPPYPFGTNAEFSFLAYNAEAFAHAAARGQSQQFLIGNNLSQSLGLGGVGSPTFPPSSPLNFTSNSIASALATAGGVTTGSSSSAGSPHAAPPACCNGLAGLGPIVPGATLTSTTCIPKDPFWMYQTAFIDLPANVALGRVRATPPRSSLTPAQFWALQQQIPLNSQRKRWRQVYNSRDHGFNLAVMKKLCQDQIRYGDKPCVLVMSTQTPDHMVSELSCALQLASVPKKEQTDGGEANDDAAAPPRYRAPTVVGTYFSVSPFKDGCVRKYFGQEGTFVFRSPFPAEEAAMEAEERRRDEAANKKKKANDGQKQEEHHANSSSSGNAAFIGRARGFSFSPAAQLVPVAARAPQQQNASSSSPCLLLTPEEIVRDSTEPPIEDLDFALRFFKVPPREDGPEREMLVAQYGSPQSSVFKPMVTLIAQRLEHLIDGLLLAAGSGGGESSPSSNNNKNNNADQQCQEVAQSSPLTNALASPSKAGAAAVADAADEDAAKALEPLPPSDAALPPSSAKKQGKKSKKNASPSSSNTHQLYFIDTLICEMVALAKDQLGVEVPTVVSDAITAASQGKSVYPSAAADDDADGDEDVDDEQDEDAQQQNETQQGADGGATVIGSLDQNNNTSFSTAAVAPKDSPKSQFLQTLAEALLLAILPPITTVGPTRPNDYFIRYTDTPQQLFCGGGGEGPSVMLSEDGTKATSYPQCDTFGSRKAIKEAKAEDEALLKRLAVMLQLMGRAKEVESTTNSNKPAPSSSSSVAGSILDRLFLGGGEKKTAGDDAASPVATADDDNNTMIPTTEVEMDAFTRIVNFYAVQLAQRRSRSVGYYDNKALFTSQWADHRRALLLPTLIKGFALQQQQQQQIIESDKMRQVKEKQRQQQQQTGATDPSSPSSPSSPLSAASSVICGGCGNAADTMASSFANSEAAAAAGFNFTQRSSSTILATTLQTNNDASGPFSLANLDAFFTITAADNANAADLHFEAQVLVECGVAEAQLQTIELWEVTDESF